MKRIQLLAVGLCISLPALADTNSEITVADYQKLIRGRGDVVSLGPDLFGDRTSLYMGDLEFVQTDISLPGNNDLPVSIARRFVVNSSNLVVRLFNDWELDIPKIHGVFAYKSAPNTLGWAPDRCSNPWAPEGVSGSEGSFFPADSLWHGTYVYVPGLGDMELLRRGGDVKPQDGRSYPLVTKDNTLFRCVASLDASSVTTGEGFEMVRPDGTVYRLDHMIQHAETSFMDPMDKPIKRNDLIILPTKVTDRFGNTVTYTWSGERLVSIVASDGRALYLTGFPVTSITDGTRTWTYQYANMGGYGNNLSVVGLPDGSSWSFSMRGLYGEAPVTVDTTCDSVNAPDPSASSVLTDRRVGAMTHPSGAVGEFTVAGGFAGRSWVPGECRSPFNDDAGKTAVDPRVIPIWRVFKKKISGPGIGSSGLVWSYNFGPANYCWSGADTASFYPLQPSKFCTSSSPTTREVQVSAPDGAVTRYVYGNRFRVNEGKLLRVDDGWNGGAAIRTTYYSYRSSDAGPYLKSNGDSLQKRGDYLVTNSNMPQESVLIDEGGVRYSSQVNEFDSFARPIRVTKSSSP